MSWLANLRSTTSLADLAALLHAKPAGLAYVLFKQPANTKYRVFAIPKRSGGKRIIKAPDAPLKLIQQKLSMLLQDCLDEIVKAKNSNDRIAHGFKRRRSILTNAVQHRNRRYVFNLDLEGFFPSINFGRVRGFFIHDRNFKLNQSVATVIAQIACHDNTLPQGSPCSPVISNLIAHVLDMHLVRLASSVGCTYSRYADDLTFSTNKKDFPQEIAKHSSTDPHQWLPGSELQELIAHAGFAVNPTKTRMQYRTSRQEVTGLIVNQKANVRHEYRHSVRAMVHHLFRTGTFEIYAPVEKAGTITIEKRPGTLNELHGRLGFIDGIDLYNRNNRSQIKDAGKLSSKEVMYRQFLIYRDVYAAERPIILCEGITDNVYLTHAIRHLAPEFPELADIAENGDIRLKVRLYKYARTSTARVLCLNDGGSGVLSSFVGTYKRETDRFGAAGMKQPVIILYDKDSGAKAIENAIQQASKTKIKPTNPFVHVVRNMYAVPTPLIDGAAESKIEDFFDATTLSIKIRGKAFSSENKFDSATYYGKRDFAYEVVGPYADHIDFSGFRPLLANLAAVIGAHAAGISHTSLANKVG